MAVAEDIAGGFVGPYEIISTLSEGRWGTTYKARDKIADVNVVIKTLQIASGATANLDHDVLAKFRQAGRKIGGVHHPSLVPLLEVGETETGVPYLVRAFVEGRSLRQVISADTPLSPKETVHYLAQLADALDTAVEKDLIHGDLKPRKIILDHSGRACLLDIGIHEVLSNTLGVRRDYFSAPRYISPEHVKVQTLTHASDQFSLAVIGFELITGYRPFPGSDFAKVVTAIVHNAPLSFLDVGIPLSQDVENVFRKGLAKDPENRYPTAMDFVADLADKLSLIIDSDGVVGAQKIDFSVRDSIDELELDIPLSDHVEEDLNDSGALLEEPEQTEKDEFVPNYTDELQEEKPYTKVVMMALGFCLVLLGYQLSLPGNSNLKSVTKLETVGDIDGARSSRKSIDRISLDTLVDAELEKYFFDAADMTYEQLNRLIIEAAKRDNEVFTKLFHELLHHDDYRIRVSTLKALARRHHFVRPGSVQAVIGRLGDKDYIVRGFAVRVITKHKNPLALSALRQFRETEQNTTVLSLMDTALLADNNSIN